VGTEWLEAVEVQDEAPMSRRGFLGIEMEFDLFQPEGLSGRPRIQHPADERSAPLLAHRPASRLRQAECYFPASAEAPAYRSPLGRHAQTQRLTPAGLEPATL
jgi:hypothetical protein